MPLHVYKPRHSCVRGCACLCEYLRLCMCVFVVHFTIISASVCASICVCIYNDLQQQGNVYSEIPDFLPSYLTDFRECQFTPYCNCSAALCNFISHLIKWILFIFHKSCAGSSSAADSHISHCSQHCSVFYRFNILPSLCGMLISYWAMILLCCPGLWGVWPW